MTLMFKVLTEVYIEFYLQITLLILSIKFRAFYLFRVFYLVPQCLSSDNNKKTLI